MRSLLSFSLEAVVSQALIERGDRPGRVLAYEYLQMTPAIRHLVRENKLHQVYSQMQMGQESHGMSTMNQMLLQYAQQGVISLTEALNHSPDPEELGRMIERAQNGGRRAG